MSVDAHNTSMDVQNTLMRRKGVRADEIISYAKDRRNDLVDNAYMVVRSPAPPNLVRIYPGHGSSLPFGGSYNIAAAFDRKLSPSNWGKIFVNDVDKTSQVVLHENGYSLTLPITETTGTHSIRFEDLRSRLGTARNFAIISSFTIMPIEWGSGGNEVDLSNYYTKAQTDARIATELINYYTEGEVDGFFNYHVTHGDHDWRYYTETELDGGVLDPRYYTETEINAGWYTKTYIDTNFQPLDGDLTIIAGLTPANGDIFYYNGDWKILPRGADTTVLTLAGGLPSWATAGSPIGHTHDDRYYTETELDAGQLDNRYYTETEIDANFQPLSPHLTDIAATTPDTGGLIYWNGSNYINLEIGNTGQVITVSGSPLLPTWKTPTVDAVNVAIDDSAYTGFGIWFGGTPDVQKLADNLDFSMTLLGSFFNGVFVQSFNALVTSNGTVVTMSLEQSGGGDLTMKFSDGPTTFDCTPAATIVLTPGTDSAPTTNYVYIPQSTKALTLSTTQWPSTEHIKVGYFLVPSAAEVLSDGCYINQNWNDHFIDTDGQGHQSHMGEAIRLTMGGATWHSGVAGAAAGGIYLDITGSSPSTVYFQSTAGISFQMHKHTVPATDTDPAGGNDDAHVVNWKDDAYHGIHDFADIVDDAIGGSLSNRYFNLVIWGVANKTGQYAPLMVNLPTGSYSTFAAAENDSSHYTVTSIPTEFVHQSTTGFLICKLTCKQTPTGTWTLHATEDLRGLSAGAAAGTGSAGGSLTDFPDNLLTVYHISDATRIIDYDLSGITTGNTRTITPSDADMTIPDTVNWTDLTDTGDTTLHIHDTRYYTETEINAGYQPLDADLTAIAGLSTANGDIMYYDSGWNRLAKGSDSEVLTLASGLPSWAAAGSPAAHTLGGASHTADTLANLNTKINDATLYEWEESQTPDVHIDNIPDLSGIYEAVDATIIRQADVDDTPMNGVTTAPISSNWAYDHKNAADPHPGYLTPAEGNAAYDAIGAAAAAVSSHESTYNHVNYNTAYGWGDHAGLYDPAGTAAALTHDGFGDYVAAEHINWTADQGATNIHAGNIPDLSGTYELAGAVSTHESTYDHANYNTAYGWGDHDGLYENSGDIATHAASADHDGRYYTETEIDVGYQPLDTELSQLATLSFANGDIMYYDSGVQRLPKGSDTEVLTLASGVPTWATASAGAHDIGGGSHNEDTLANLNTKISDATLYKWEESQTPDIHIDNIPDLSSLYAADSHAHYDVHATIKTRDGADFTAGAGAGTTLKDVKIFTQWQIGIRVDSGNASLKANIGGTIYQAALTSILSLPSEIF